MNESKPVKMGCLVMHICAQQMQQAPKSIKLFSYHSMRAMPSAAGLLFSPT